MSLNVMSVSLILFIAFCMGGCYNPSTFKSDSADMLISTQLWSSPKCRIVFEELVVEESGAKAEYQIENPPPAEMLVGLNFTDTDDLKRLAEAGAVVGVTLYNDRGEILFQFREPLDEAVTYISSTNWMRVGVTTMQPPANWNESRKGQVVEEWSVYPRETGVGWGAAKNGLILAAGTWDPELPKRCRVSVEVSLEGRLSRRASLYPTLIGGWPGAL